MKKIIAVISILALISQLAGCAIFQSSSSDSNAKIVISDKTLDISVDKVKAKALGQQLFDTVPALSTLRDKIEKDTGKTTKLTISVQSSPDPQGINDYEKNNYFMYVSYMNDGKLAYSYTFLMNKDDNSILVFDESGDNTISVAKWALSVGVN
jgi:hypothetical protein